MTTTRTMDFSDRISRLARSIDTSGIRKVFELGAKLKNPINLSIGQPDFPVPEAIKQATIQAIRDDRNGYTLTQGTPELLHAVARHLKVDVGWDTPSDDVGLLITSGTSGALLLAFMSLIDPGDEAIIPDPYFVLYPNLGKMTGATMVYCDTYSDFRMTAERVEPLITPRTKLLIVCSPNNPCGVVLGSQELRDLADLCESRGVLLISDEIYDRFTYSDALEDDRCPSPARFTDRVLLVRGFGKTYGCTGWRMGYVAGPRAVVEEIKKFQQYTYVCPPSMAQVGLAGAFDVDMGSLVTAYEHKRNMVLKAFQGVAQLVHPGGAFYAFVQVPPRLGQTASQFAERAIERNVLVIPGKVFSRRDTHFRLSYATADDRLAEGLAILTDLMGRP